MRIHSQINVRTKFNLIFQVFFSSTFYTSKAEDHIHSLFALYDTSVFDSNQLMLQICQHESKNILLREEI